MTKYTKAGLLIVTLVIPALIFTFLRFFATNHYQIPIYHPLKGGSGEVLIENGDTLFYTAAGFRAAAQPGKQVDERVFNNKLSVVFFEPENCDEKCKITWDNLDRVYQLREGIGMLQLLTIGGADAAIHHPGRPGWMQLTVSDTMAVIRALRISGEERVILLDEKRHIRGYYNGAGRDETDRLMAEVKILDFEKKGSNK